MNDRIYDHILIDQQQLDDCISRLAGEIDSAYAKHDNLLALVILEGARTFADKLFAKLNRPVDVEYIKTASYHGGTKSSGKVDVDIDRRLYCKMADHNVLIVDDIYDTGLTLSSVIQHLRQFKPRSLKTCVLLEKRIEHIQKISIDFVGQQIENVFVVGFGLDYQNQYRELPFVATVRRDLIQ